MKMKTASMTPAADCRRQVVIAFTGRLDEKICKSPDISLRPRLHGTCSLGPFLPIIKAGGARSSKFGLFDGLSLLGLENLGLATLAKHQFGGYDQSTPIGALGRF